MYDNNNVTKIKYSLASHEIMYGNNLKQFAKLFTTIESVILKKSRKIICLISNLT